MNSALSCPPYFWCSQFSTGEKETVSLVRPKHNKSLQRTFDPMPTFATAKASIASNAAELRRYMALL